MSGSRRATGGPAPGPPAERRAAHRRADLITATASGLLATLLPFHDDPEVGPHESLLGHLARNNDQWRRPALGDALVVVRGPDAYVSPGW